MLKDFGQPIGSFNVSREACYQIRESKYHRIMIDKLFWCFKELKNGRRKHQMYLPLLGAGNWANPYGSCQII